MSKYRGITYFKFLDGNYAHRLWAWLFCPKDIHLFDECQSDDHYLHCDACGLCVYIEKIETAAEVTTRLAYRGDL